MPLQARCGLGMGVAILSIILITMTLSPGVDTVLCKCKHYNTDNNWHSLCVPFGASISDIAKRGDDVILFVYWILVMTVSILCLRVAGLITFFHSDEANQCFAIDGVVNAVCCVMTLLASAVIIGWAKRDKDCDVIFVTQRWLASVPLLSASFGASALVTVIDIITVCATCMPYAMYYSPVVMVTQDSRSQIELSTPSELSEGKSVAVQETEGSYTIDDEESVDIAIQCNGVI